MERFIDDLGLPKTLCEIGVYHDSFAAIVKLCTAKGRNPYVIFSANFGGVSIVFFTRIA